MASSADRSPIFWGLNAYVHFLLLGIPIQSLSLRVQDPNDGAFRAQIPLVLAYLGPWTRPHVTFILVQPSFHIARASPLPRISRSREKPVTQKYFAQIGVLASRPHYILYSNLHYGDSQKRDPQILGNTKSPAGPPPPH